MESILLPSKLIPLPQEANRACFKDLTEVIDNVESEQYVDDIDSSRNEPGNEHNANLSDQELKCKDTATSN